MSDPSGTQQTQQQSSATSVPHTPDKPKMGGIKKGQYHVAWTGGEPKPDWEDGLVQPNPKHIGQFQRRYEDGKAAIFGYER